MLIFSSLYFILQVIDIVNNSYALPMINFIALRRIIIFIIKMKEKEKMIKEKRKKKETERIRVFVLLQ